ncbi:MAG: hypothetical protein ACK50E_07485 [Bacteroidota bacterium]|jgi:hypothetical protein
MSAYRRKSWVEKRDINKDPVVKKLDKDFADMHAGEKMLIATPLIVDNYIRQIQSGHQLSLGQMRKDLAAEYHADVTCPVTSGIFLRIVAEAAWEEYQAGKPIKNITPFWRIIDTRSSAAKKLSFGTDFLLERRKKEKLPPL